MLFETITPEPTPPPSEYKITLTEEEARGLQRILGGLSVHACMYGFGVSREQANMLSSLGIKLPESGIAAPRNRNHHRVNQLINNQDWRQV